MEHSPTFAAPTKRFFSTPEFIAFLRDYAGMTISKSTAFKWSVLGKIPCQKAPNGRLLFPVDKVQQWIESGNVEQEAEARARRRIEQRRRAVDSRSISPEEAEAAYERLNRETAEACLNNELRLTGPELMAAYERMLKNG